MYKNFPVRLDIAGSVASIEKITKETLYLCYDNFYTPSNMALVVCGDFKPWEILEQIKKRLIKKEKKELPQRLYPNEPNEINEKEKCVDMKLSNPLFAIGYKDRADKDMIKRHIAIEIIKGALFGKSSKLNKELTDTNDILGPLDGDYDFSKNYAFLLITGASRKPEEVIKKIKSEIEKAKNIGIDQESFERSKKKFYGDTIVEYNSVEETARMFLSDYFKGINAFEYLEKYEEVTKEYTEQVLREVFSEERSVVSIVK